jgi:hypothetical protein
MSFGLFVFVLRDCVLDSLLDEEIGWVLFLFEFGWVACFGKCSYNFFGFRIVYSEGLRNSSSFVSGEFAVDVTGVNCVPFDFRHL